MIHIHRLGRIVVAAALLLAAPVLRAQEPESKKPAPEKPDANNNGQVKVVGVSETKNNTSAAERNENVWVSKLDNDALKAEGSRLGIDVTIVSRPVVERTYYAAEHGQTPADFTVPNPSKVSGWHGELFEAHRNSVFNARTFFQVGPVMPSRSNQYGVRLSGPALSIGNIMATLSQRQVGGAVNGNVHVPLLSERTPTATDPETRAIVSGFLVAYPATPPNLPELDERALNTNAVQVIHQTDAALIFDREFSGKHQLHLDYSLNRQYIDAFQFVAGANPDTSIHTHRARIGYLYVVSELTNISFALGFSRVASDLRPEPNAVGPRVRFGHALEDLGPDAQYPINRAQNTFRWGAVGYHRVPGGRHLLTFGADIYRAQVNGIQTNNQRGSFQFSNNFGRTAIENLLMGTPTQYEVSLGNMNRGFRNWQVNSFLADQWTVTSRLQLYLGLRHSLETAPVEVNRINTMPYGTDWNNFSPRVSLAWRGPVGWITRASYTISYGQIPSVTYGQIRYNAPSIYVIVPNPNLVDPLQGVDLEAGRTSPFVFSTDMVAPYSHQYNLAFERKLFDLLDLRLGYVGSRTFKVLTGYVLNRALPVPGIPLTTATVNQRRPDPRYYSVKQIGNAGIAYLDAAQASVAIPYRRGFAANLAFTFSKAIDEGNSYVNVAANKDLDHASQSQFNSLEDKKSLSDFDSTRSFTAYFTYDMPKLGVQNAVLKALVNGWQIAGAVMVRTGTPFYVTVGSDGPGYGNVDGEVGDRPNILDPSILGATIGHPDTSTGILRRDRFSYIVPGKQRGNLAWNAFRKQGIRNINAAASRQWKWGGNRPYMLQFRAEAFNLGNHAQFDAPQYTLTSPSFGKITNTLNDGRVLQFGLRLSF